MRLAKLHLSRAGNQKGVIASGAPCLALWVSRPHLIGPPLRTFGAARQGATENCLYFGEAQFKIPELEPCKVVS